MHGNTRVTNLTLLLVIVHDEQLPRGMWKLGKIEQLMKDRDGLIRAVVVKVVNKEGQQSLLKRPIQLLYPLK